MLKFLKIKSNSNYYTLGTFYVPPWDTCLRAVGNASQHIACKRRLGKHSELWEAYEDSHKTFHYTYVHIPRSGRIVS